MKKIENNKVRMTLDEAKKTKGRSNPAKIVAEQRKDQMKEKKEK